MNDLKKLITEQAIKVHNGVGMKDQLAEVVDLDELISTAEFEARNMLKTAGDRTEMERLMGVYLTAFLTAYRYAEAKR